MFLLLKLRVVLAIYVLLILVLLLSSHSVHCFSISRLPHDTARGLITKTTRLSNRFSHHRHHHQYDCWKANSLSLKMNTDDDYEEDEEEDEDEEDLDYLSPSQIKALRKEASKREANKILPRIAYHNDVGITPIMLICSTFASNELVTISSIYYCQDNNNNNNNTKHRSNVKPAAEQLAYDLSCAMQNKPVFLISIQGYSATFYSPFPKAQVAKNRIPLHSSSYKPNQWSKRLKAPRDVRGQIVQE